MTTILSVFLSFIVLSSSGNLELSRNYAKAQEWEKAAEYALKAVDDANHSKDNIRKAEALIHLSNIDIMNWRDEQAWKNASMAEAIAREAKCDTLIADALLNKGKLCVFSNITGEDSGEEKSLPYFMEALKLSKDNPRRQVVIYYNLSQAYVGMNRLNDPIDQEIYKKAGDAIEAGEKIALENNYVDLQQMALTFKMRYLRQGGRIQEAIECCNNNLENCAKDDYLMQTQVFNQLVALYAQDGKIEESVSAHQNYANATLSYMKQKSDNLIQEMETRYQAAEKENRISLLREMVYVLVFFLLLLGVFALFMFRLNGKLKKQKQSLDLANSGKEELLKLVSEEFTNPTYNKQIHQSVQKMSKMDEAGIREYCSSLFNNSDNNLGEELSDFFVNLIENRRKVAEKFGLTAREMEIVRCCREGMSNAQIADNLNISLSTVKNHKQNIFSKMNVRSVTEMLSVASETGLM